MTEQKPVLLRALRYGWGLIKEGQTKFLFAEVWMNFYKFYQEYVFRMKHRDSVPPANAKIRVETQHPIAFESPDHLNPWGTSRDNSTNKKFVDFMSGLIRQQSAAKCLGMLDLGCSGGQLVEDFRSLGWIAVGLEGSDFSLKHKRANWLELAGKNLFTCDISKPFCITVDGERAKFHLITCWEVLEHIQENDLPQVFKNILEHLDKGGYFIATTTSDPDIHNGIDLHQTKWSNQQWRRMLAANFPELEPVKLKLRFYHFVRHNQEGSVLVYRKR